VNAVDIAFGSEIDHALRGAAEPHHADGYAPAQQRILKKVENIAHAVSLHYMVYNFARPRATLAKDAEGRKMTPAVAAGVTNRVWTRRDTAALLD
jgi:hypothetical protein